MIENLVTRFCSPTLAGLKTGSLFTVRGRKIFCYRGADMLMEYVAGYFNTLR